MLYCVAVLILLFQCHNCDVNEKYRKIVMRIAYEITTKNVFECLVFERISNYSGVVSKLSKHVNFVTSFSQQISHLKRRIAGSK